MRSPMGKQVIEVESEEEEEETEDDEDERCDDEDMTVEDEKSTEGLDESPKRKEKGGTSRRGRGPSLKTDIDEFKDYLDNKLNPCFPIDMTKQRARIPAALIKDYNLRFPKVVTMRDNIGKLERKIVVWKNRSVILNGVGSIRQRNYVKPGDKDVCELKMVNGYHGLVREVKIHIIRG